MKTKSGKMQKKKIIKKIFQNVGLSLNEKKTLIITRNKTNILKLFIY